MFIEQTLIFTIHNILILIFNRTIIPLAPHRSHMKNLQHPILIILLLTLTFFFNLFISISQNGVVYSQRIMTVSIITNKKRNLRKFKRKPPGTGRTRSRRSRH
ncbi:hypothetical protein HanRHA438_Chr04g0186571 [Helianthus annuus]|nr:hypothetical protein HanRHA438_Chr04g0186571 [Helianthus annuus]